jgi:hypothetical protein
VVNNEKVGRLFVVEGKAINRFPGAKELIKIRVDLMDKNKKPVLSRDFYCGNTVTLFQLQVYTAEELDAALNAKTGILNNNTNLDPGDEAPFMIVVPNPPDSVKEFQVMVVDARDAVPVES